MVGLSPLTRLAGAIAVVAVVVAAIALSLPAAGPGGPPATTEGTPTPQTTPVALASAQPTPTPSVEPSPWPTVSATPDDAVSPTLTPGEALAQSDGFWNRWIGPPNPSVLDEFGAVSLADVTRQADLIIRGRVTDIYIGEYWRMKSREKLLPLVYVRVEIDEVLKGEPASRTAGFVEAQIGSSPDDLDQVRATIPEHGNVWFLMYGPNWDERRFEPQRSSEMAQYAYFVFNFWQGILRGINGEVRVMQPDSVAADLGRDFFPLPLNGMEFEQIVDQVRDLVRSAPEASPTVP